MSDVDRLIDLVTAQHVFLLNACKNRPDKQAFAKHYEELVELDVIKKRLKVLEDEKAIDVANRSLEEARRSKGPWG